MKLNDISDIVFDLSELIFWIMVIFVMLALMGLAGYQIFILLFK